MTRNEERLLRNKDKENAVLKVNPLKHKTGARTIGSNDRLAKTLDSGRRK